MSNVQSFIDGLEVPNKVIRGVVGGKPITHPDMHINKWSQSAISGKVLSMKIYTIVELHKPIPVNSVAGLFYTCEPF